jgi:hypothetical protein
VVTLCIVLKSTAVTAEPDATYTNDSWHFMFIGAPVTEVVPTQHDERADDDVVVSQTLTYYSKIKGFNIGLNRSIELEEMCMYRPCQDFEATNYMSY